MRVSNSGAPFPDDLDIAQGPGLGLQLVHLLVEQLEGRVELESRAPTTFRISIPRQVFQAAI